MSRPLTLAAITIFCILYRIEASSNEISEKFRQEEIVPDVLEDLPEIKLLKITYPSKLKVNLGNILTPTQVKEQPKVEYDAEEGAFYTLLMTDPDAPSRKEPSRREFRHWLTVNIPGSDINEGDTVFQYIGSGPPQGTGLHRYVFLLFKQQTGKIVFESPFVSDHSSLNRPSTSTRDLISKNNLKLVAGNFYQAEYDDYVPELHAQLAGKKLPK